MKFLGRGLSKSDVDALERSIPTNDPIAQRNPERPLYSGTHEEIEEALVPWLRRRRRAARQRSRRSIW
jgi:hypothetical protein